MSATFTSGPWKHRATVNAARGDGASWREIEDANGCIIGEVFHDQDEGPEDSFISDETAEANARLIAAAPELYEALVGLVEGFIERGPFDEPLGSSEQSPLINAGLAALAKARGEAA